MVESERVSGQPKPQQRTKHYLGNYAEAKVALATLDISPEQQQKFAARMEELEAVAVAKRQSEPRSRRGRPRKTKVITCLQMEAEK